MSKLTSLCAGALLTGAFGLSLVGDAAPAAAETLTKDVLVKLAPEHGLPAVGKFKPTWCRRVGAGYGVRALGRQMDTYLWSNLDETLKAACADPDEPVFQEQVGYYLQRWVNASGLKPEQLRPYFELRIDKENYVKLANETCAKVTVGDESSPREQAFGKALATLFGCAYGNWNDRASPLQTGGLSSLPNDLLWHLDRTAEPPSQLVLLERVNSCLPEDATLMDWSVPRFAACRADLALLDEQKLAAEIKAGGYNDYARHTATLALGRTRLVASLVEKELQAKAAKDEDVKRLLIDAPERAWKEWEAAYQANQAAIALAHAYEDKMMSPRVSARKGCLAEAEKNLATIMAGVKGKTAEELIAAATSVAGGIVLGHAYTCNEAEGRKTIAGVYEQILMAGPPRRGPRFAVQQAMAVTLGEILADRPKFSVSAQHIPSAFDAPVPVGRGGGFVVRSDEGVKKGVVAKVEKKGDKVFVTFKAHKWKEPEYHCVDTNRIARIDSSGNITYQQSCKATGKMVEMSQTTDPFFTSPELAEGLAPGVFATYLTGSIAREGGAFEGVPYLIWKNADRKALIAVFGLKAK